RPLLHTHDAIAGDGLGESRPGHRQRSEEDDEETAAARGIHGKLLDIDDGIVGPGPRIVRRHATNCRSVRRAALQRVSVTMISLPRRVTVSGGLRYSVIVVPAAPMVRVSGLLEATAVDGTTVTPGSIATD